MFFEGCSSQHLGCTVLLRGTSNSELAKLKRVVSRLVFTHFSWRLEKSFLMDEFALPPSPVTDSFFEEPVTSDSSQIGRIISSTTNSSLCLENDSAVVLSSSELLHESFEVGVGEPEILHVPSPEKGITDNRGVRNGTCSVPVACTLPCNTAEENAKDGNIRSCSRSDVPPSSSVQFNENVQSENSSASNRKRHVCCDKAEHPSPSCTNCNKVMASGNKTQIVVGRESRNSSAGEERVREPIRQPTQAKEPQASPYQTDCDSGKTRAARSMSKEKSLSEEKRTNVESVSDFSDPLHLYLNLDDEVFISGSGQLAVAELPLTNRFRKALDDIILSSSPYLQVTLSSGSPHTLITAQNVMLPGW
jgi:1-phosphatidylinositol-3-phosphate 5-kinase